MISCHRLTRLSHTDSLTGIASVRLISFRLKNVSVCVKGILINPRILGTEIGFNSQINS